MIFFLYSKIFHAPPAIAPLTPQRGALISNNSVGVGQRRIVQYEESPGSMENGAG